MTIEEQQREALRALLAEGEQVVPSMTARILKAVRKEARAQGTPPMAVSPQSAPAGQQERGWRDLRNPSRPVTRSRSPVWRNVAAAVMAAVIILAALLIYSYRLHLNGSQATGHSATATAHITQQTPAPRQSPGTVSSSPTPAAPNTLYGGWNSAMIAFPSNSSGQFTIKNYDYTNGFSQILGAKPLPASTQFDGIASSGQDLLYQYTSSNHVYYARLLTPLAHTGYFYELNADNAGNAIWLDTRYVLINTKHMGVIEVDSLTGQETPYLPNLAASSLLSVHHGYLYFIDSNSFIGRVNASTGRVQMLAGHSLNPSAWISPDGSLLYWVNDGTFGQRGIYETNLANGTSNFIRGSGEPVGFAADNSLLIVELVNGQFQIVKLGTSPQQDQVIFANAAPGAALLCPATLAKPRQICDSFTAMAPYGHAVIMQGTNPDGRYHLWSDDIVTGQQIALNAAQGNTTFGQLLGWDRLPLSER